MSEDCLTDAYNAIERFGANMAIQATLVGMVCLITLPAMYVAQIFGLHYANDWSAGFGLLFYMAINARMNPIYP